MSGSTRKKKVGHGDTGEIGVRQLLIDDVREAISDPNLSDVTLRASDGSLVPACRFLLAARSRVFRSMLYGPFSEASSDVVTVCYPGDVVRVIVHYCLFADLPSTSPSSHSQDEEGDRVVRSMVGVVQAAHFFDLCVLEQAAFRRVVCLFEQNPPLACVVLQVSRDGTTPTGGGATTASTQLLCEKALDVIRFRTRESLLPKVPEDSTRPTFTGILGVGPAVLSDIIKDKKLHADELTLFHCICQWAQSVPTLDTETGEGTSPCTLVTGQKRPRQLDQGKADLSGNDGHVSLTRSDRFEIAKKLVYSIQLKKIPPSELRNLVAKSGLVDKDQLASAFEAQALKAEQLGFQFMEAPRSTTPPQGRVLVQGAGIAGINGEYVPWGKCDGVTKYCKAGQLDEGASNNHLVFTLFRFCSMDGTRKWFISHVPTNVNPGATDDDKDFYFSTHDYDTPFSQHWIRKEYGIDPAPRCIWEPHDESDDHESDHDHYQYDNQFIIF